MFGLGREGHFSGHRRPARTEMVPGLQAVGVRTSGRSAQLFGSTSFSSSAVEVVRQRPSLVLGFDLRQQRAAPDRELPGDDASYLLPVLPRGAFGCGTGVWRGRPLGLGLLGGSPRASSGRGGHSLEDPALAPPFGGRRGRQRLSHYTLKLLILRNIFY